MSSRCYLYEMADKQYPSDKQDKFMLRFPEGMRERIRVAAEKNGRSMNAEIVSRLDESFRSAEMLERVSDMSADLDRKLAETREELASMEKARAEASNFIKEIRQLRESAEKEE